MATILNLSSKAACKLANTSYSVAIFTVDIHRKAWLLYKLSGGSMVLKWIEMINKIQI